ncbi:MAG TPA: demethylmenaquinone methyltransferase [Actinomyces sp.]|jgi:demethylmenaquinone methyltransferase/2-methoxy-6-polyprenyl-1,4-benzoquinol methylase|nr:demethylmenaquinone methyltransferase [Acidobacteriota bacterium]HHT40588.1 demethylmenaquinone methyltransferase [Actinomyces sp.]
MTLRPIDPADINRASLDKKPHEVAGMFNKVAHRYDLTNEALTLGQVHIWRRGVRIALNPRPGELILDLAAGTGGSTAALAESGAEVVACDLSEGMIAVGRQRHPELKFVQGDATDLPFEDATFDAVTISFGLRNVENTEKALREMARVVKPGGRLVICEFSRPTWPPFRAVYGFYLEEILTRIAGVLSSDDEAYDYLIESIQEWPDQERLGALIARSGWKHVQYRNYTGGILALHRAVRSE